MIKKNQPFVFDTFSGGTIKDPPACEINDCLADSLNLTIYPKYYEGRTGCVRFGTAPFPAIVPVMEAHKVGDHIFADAGAVFAPDHVGCFMGFGDDFELITEYISQYEVVGSDTTYKETLTGKVIGALNIFHFHKVIRKWIILIGTEIYAADPEITAWTKVNIISRESPFSARSNYEETRNKLLIYNGNGIFKVNLDSVFPIAYKINVDVPATRISSSGSGAHRYRYVYSYLRITKDGGVVDRQSSAEIEMETGSTIANADGIDYGEMLTSDEITAATPNLITPLVIPLSSEVPQFACSHLTHYGIYRTLDLESIDPSDVSRSEYNDPNKYVWVADIPMVTAFLCRTSAGHIYIEIGSIGVWDVGSVVVFDSGETVTLTSRVSSIEGLISNPSLELTSRAGTIGLGYVIRGYVTGDVFTRTAGLSLEYLYEDRRVLWNSEGKRFSIVAPITANSVQINVVGDQPEQGWSFVSADTRSFNDTITDDMLQARKASYSCMTRYRSPLPNCNLGKIIPGFMVCTKKWTKRIYYSHVQEGYDYLMGQYIKTQVSDSVQDTITAMIKFKDVLSFVCSNSTWGTPIGLSEFMTMPGSNEAVALLPGITQTNKNIGCVDTGSITECEGDVVSLITNEQGSECGRFFNGTSYSEEDWLVDQNMGGRITKDLHKTKRLSQMIYDGFLGLVGWRKNA